jgi:hypothetical protein
LLALFALCVLPAAPAQAQLACIPGIVLPGCPTPEPPEPETKPPPQYPEPEAACPVERRTRRAFFAGVYADDVFVGGPRYRDCELNDQVRAGVTTIRAQFLWNHVERERNPGVFDWRFYDAYVGALARHGIRFLPLVLTPPKHRSTAPPGHPREPFFKPKSNAELAGFVAAGVRRYGPRGEFWTSHPDVPYLPVRMWQVWNEPNIPIFWPTGPSAREYVQMLAEVARAVRAVDPNAEIVSAGIPDSRLGIPMLRYVRQMMRAGARRHMNTLALNPYSRNTKGVTAQLVAARRLLDRMGGRRIALRVTEAGWASGGPRHAFNRGPVGQARRLRVMFRELYKRRRALKLRGVIWFNWRDTPPYRADFWGLHTGLKLLDGTPKPAYAAFRSATRRLR